MIEFRDSHRLASIILLDSAGNVLGKLAAVKLSTPWFQEIGELINLTRARFGITVTILRLLQVDDSRLPEIEVSYLAQTNHADVDQEWLLPWGVQLDEQPLRLAYAKPGGPDLELSWAEERLKQHGFGEVTEKVQVRTWNLSSIWRLIATRETFWLKSVPPFFAHEGSVLKLFAGEKVPDLVATDKGRMLLRHLPGEDCYDANLDQMLVMINRLVDLQWRWQSRLDELFTAGMPSARYDVLAQSIPAVVNQYFHELKEEHKMKLTMFVDTLPARLAQLEKCGIPESFVHGDYHPGNWRGIDLDLTILDWGDCCVGHPLLDLPALIDRAGEHEVALISRWREAWQEKLPDANVADAIHLVMPIATARAAVVFQHFLENIEPSERIFHDSDPVLFLRKTAEALP